MGITLGIAIDKKSIEPKPYVLLDEEIIQYLTKLEEFSALYALSKLDPYGDTLLDKHILDHLRREVVEVIDRLGARQMPEPPENVGLEGGEDASFGEKFGWEGLERFLSNLDQLLTEASLRGKPLLAVGD